MKTHRITPFLVGSLALAALTFNGLHAQTPATFGGQFGGRAPMTVRLASAEIDSFALGQLAGKPLLGANRQQLGSISDFLIDPASGRIHYAVVPSGAGEGGETFRLVPMAALERGAGMEEGLTARIGPEQWSQVGTMTTAELPARVTITADRHGRLAQQFALANNAAAQAAAGELVRASSLRGQALRANNEQVGTIEDVAVDVRRGVAAALLKSATGFTGSEQKFLVPFRHLQLSGAPGAGATTSLTRNEFQQAQMPTPTGYPGGGGAFMRGGHPAQSAVQQAVNQTTGNSEVQVAAETWLILRGTVENEQKKGEIERAAQQAAPGLPIDNKVTIKNQ